MNYKLYNGVDQGEELKAACSLTITICLYSVIYLNISHSCSSFWLTAPALYVINIDEYKDPPVYTININFGALGPLQIDLLGLRERLV